MAEYIDKAKLYNTVVKLEEKARTQYLEASAYSEKAERAFARLSERTAFKHLVEDFRAADVALVVHGKWRSVFFGDEWKIKCSNCGRLFDRFADGAIAPKHCFCGAKMDLEESK